MNFSLSSLLPQVNQPYRGYKVVFYFLILITTITTVRSLIHMFAADGGAGSIAGIDMAVAGGSNVVTIFGQWGASQLLMALFDWIVIFRYQFLTPLAFGLLFLEQCLRLLEGYLKPITAAHTPPGAIGTDVLLPLLAIAFVLSLFTRSQ